MEQVICIIGDYVTSLGWNEAPQYLTYNCELCKGIEHISRKYYFKLSKEARYA